MKQFVNSKFSLPLALIFVVTCYFLTVYDLYSVLDNRDARLFPWTVHSWNERNNLEHGYLIPKIFIIMTALGYKHSLKESSEDHQLGVLIGLLGIVFGLLCYLMSIRCILGWNKGRHFIVPSFILYFAIPVPGLNQITNGLQVIVTGWCYEVGSSFGMDLLRIGNTIKSSTEEWGFDIAEGCSGIKSLMALFMIAAVYAYYTQNKLWKKTLLFSAAFPLALVGNFFRVFTIIVFAEMGYADFAANFYHDWAGLLLFFPLTLGGLFVIDKLMNRKKRKKIIKIKG